MKTKEFIILDDVDWRILEILQENGKETYTEIGRKLHLAHSTVYDRIKRMESKGIIRKYTAIIDLEKCGVKHLVAILTIYTDPKRIEKIAEQVSQHKQVPEVFFSLYYIVEPSHKAVKIRSQQLSGLLCAYKTRILAHPCRRLQSLMVV